jgi:hypothetical protein
MIAQCKDTNNRGSGHDYYSLFKFKNMIKLYKMKTKTSILTLTNIFFILVAMCCFSSCDNTNDLVVETQLIDGCEYIVSRNIRGDVVSHKGNCNNPFHNKVIYDTIYVIKVK